MNHIKKTNTDSYEVNGKPVTVKDYRDKLNQEEIHFFQQYLKARYCDGLKIQSSIY